MSQGSLSGPPTMCKTGDGQPDGALTTGRVKRSFRENDIFRYCKKVLVSVLRWTTAWPHRRWRRLEGVASMFKGPGLSKCLANASMSGKELIFPHPMKSNACSI